MEQIEFYRVVHKSIFLDFNLNHESIVLFYSNLKMHIPIRYKSKFESNIWIRISRFSVCRLKPKSQGKIFEKKKNKKTENNVTSTININGME